MHGAMVAQLTVNQEVVGSSPTAPAKNESVAQRLEQAWPEITS